MFFADKTDFGKNSIAPAPEMNWVMTVFLWTIKSAHGTIAVVVDKAFVE